MLLAAMLVAAPAEAATMSADSSPEVVSSAADDVTYRVTVSTDAGDETVVLISPMPLVGEGPAAVKTLVVAASPPAVPACPDGSRPPHRSAGPFFVSSWYYEVDLPDGAAEVFTGHRHLRRAPWPEDVVYDLAPTFALAPAFGRPPVATVVAPAPPFAGPLGVRILLSDTTPGSPRQIAVRRGSSIVLTGRVFAPVVGDNVSLLAGGPGKTPPRLIARTPVRPDGTLAYRWHPARPGHYRITAVYAYANPRSGYLRTTSDCSLLVSVRR